MDNRWISVIPALLLSSTHVILAFPIFDFTFRKADTRLWSSIAGGVAASYVFIQLIPELVNNTREVERELNGQVLVTRLVFLCCFLGFFTFYVMESVIMSFRQKDIVDQEDQENQYVSMNQVIVLPRSKKTYLYLLHLITFGISNIVVGSLLPSRLRVFGMFSLWLYWVATETFYIVIDFSSKNHFPRRYNTYGKWVLFLFTIIGWLIGYFIIIPRYVQPLISSTLAGITIMTIIKEQLPSPKGNPNITMFICSSLSFGVILLFL